MADGTPSSAAREKRHRSLIRALRVCTGILRFINLCSAANQGRTPCTASPRSSRVNGDRGRTLIATHRRAADPGRSRRRDAHGRWRRHVFIPAAGGGIGARDRRARAVLLARPAPVSGCVAATTAMLRTKPTTATRFRTMTTMPGRSAEPLLPNRAHSAGGSQSPTA
jgi:hypothetical protein